MTDMLTKATAVKIVAAMPIPRCFAATAVCAVYAYGKWPFGVSLQNYSVLGVRMGFVVGQ